MSSTGSERAGGRAWLARNGAGLLVALGAAAATAHGLYEVAHASKVPAGIAWLYPLITDGLGAVAYSATARLAGKAAGYAWGCVVLAAGLSGLAQAVYLAADTVIADPVLRFGVGAWPAIACALVAHLLHLTLTSTSAHGVIEEPADGLAVDGPADDRLVGPVQAVAIRTDTSTEQARAALDGPAGERDGERDETGGAHFEDRSDPSTDPGADTGAAPDREVGDDQTADGVSDGVGGDGRVLLLRELLAAGAEVTGPQAAALLTHRAGAAVSDRTARRLLAAARDAARDAGCDAGCDHTGGAGSCDHTSGMDERPVPRARLVLLPTGTTTSSDTSRDTSRDTDEGDPR